MPAIASNQKSYQSDIDLTSIINPFVGHKCEYFKSVLSSLHPSKLFHLIVLKISRIKLPSYLRSFEGSSRLSFTHLDHLCLITDTVPAGLYNATSERGFANSYFYRTRLSWNRLPLYLREIMSPSKFKIK